MMEILEKLSILLYDAQNGKFHAGKEFERDNYKWKLGAKIAYEICVEEEKTHIFIGDFKEEKMSVYGIEVEYDYQNPEKIELWERVGSIE